MRAYSRTKVRPQWRRSERVRVASASMGVRDPSSGSLGLLRGGKLEESMDVIIGLTVGSHHEAPYRYCRPS